MNHKSHINEFEAVDWVTFGGLLVALAVWYIVSVVVFSQTMVEFLWLSVAPAVLLAVFASRRWSALITIGPASVSTPEEKQARD